MKIVTSQEITTIDRLTIEEYKIPSLVLMERAALSVVKHIVKMSAKNLIILAGPGNNGGDGIAAGRILKNKVKKLTIFQPFCEDKLSQDCKTQLEIAQKFNIPIIRDYPQEKEIVHADVIIDAFFGTGLKRPIDGKLAQFIEKLNTFKKIIVAVDIASGICSDTGQFAWSCG